MYLDCSDGESRVVGTYDASTTTLKLFNKSLEWEGKQNYFPLLLSHLSPSLLFLRIIQSLGSLRLKRIAVTTREKRENLTFRM